MKKIAPLLMIFSLSACSQKALLVSQSDEIMKLSEEYFNNLAAQKYDTAYSSISSALKQISSEELWAEDKQKFRQLSGEVSLVNITKVTVYENLASAPLPGTYIAADYYNKFTNVPIHCGYLVWYKPDSSKEKYKIVREESGYITKRQLAQLPIGKLPEVEKGLQCR